MLKFDATRVVISNNRKVSPGHQITAEGAALVAVIGPDGEAGLQMSQGLQHEVFAGFSVNETTAQSSLPKVINSVVESDATDQAFIQCIGAPITGTVAINVEGQKYTSGSKGSANQFEIDETTNRILLHSDAKGKAVKGAYRFAPTMMQLAMLQGMPNPGGPVSHYLDITGVIESGDVFTTEWDTTADWSADKCNNLYLHTGGKISTTQKGSNATKINGYVIQAPSDDGFLGICIK